MFVDTRKPSSRFHLLLSALLIFTAVLALLPPSVSAADGLVVQYRAADTEAGNNQIKPHFNVVNNGSSTVALSELTIRYWYTIDGEQTQQFHCDYARISCSNVSGEFVSLDEPADGANYYLEISFASGAGTLAPGSETGEIQARFNKTDWTNYDESNDFSFDPSKTSFTDWENVTLYQNGEIVWGTVPAGQEPTPPEAPANVTAAPGDGKVDLSWSAVDRADSYTVKRATASGGSYATLAGDLTDTAYTDGSVTNGTTYYYVVSAVNAYGESAHSVEVSATPETSDTPPDAPTGLAATAGNEEIRLSWEAVSDASGYHVKRSTTAGGPYTTVADDVADNAYTDTNLTNGTRYYYVVSAVNSAGESANSSEVSAVPRLSPSDFTPQEFTEELSPGWNLGNTLDAIPTEGSWNNPPVEEHTFDDIKAAGFKSVRIPVTWTDHLGAAPDYMIDAEWMDRVEEVVDWALERDFYVVLNVHHDSWQWVGPGMVSDQSGTLDQLGKIWAQIADRFKDKSDKLIFEIINEPPDMSAYQLNVLNQEMLDIIRSSGGNNDDRLVVVGGLDDNREELLNTFELPDDENLVLTFHYYNPWHYISRWWGKVDWGSDEEIATMHDNLQAVYDQYVTQGYPVIIGEYGTLGKNERHSKWLYHDEFVRTAYDMNMVTMWWDNGNDHFDRINRVWRDPVVKDVVVQAGQGVTNSIVTTPEIYIEANATVTDRTVDMKLNGNQLEAILYDGNELTEGTDYTYDAANGQVTLDANYLSGLLQPSQLGTNAVLTFRFSQGAEQKLDIIQYTAPVIENDTYTIDLDNISGDLLIPVELNGTKLATAKGVVDSTGQPILAEEWSWTPYMNYNDDFIYEDGNLVIRERVLNYLTEDSTVTFEFWPQGVTLEVHLVTQ